MKKMKKIISQFIAIITVVCLAAINVSAASFVNLDAQAAGGLSSIGDTQLDGAAFTITLRPHSLAVAKPSELASKKRKPTHPETKKEKPNDSAKEESVPSSSTENSTAMSSNSSASAPLSSEDSSSSSSIVNSEASSKPITSLLIPCAICLVLGTVFAAVAIVMSKNNKKNASSLDETSEIQINDDTQQPVDKNKK